MSKKSPEEEYKEIVGRDPHNLPDDHPDLWQWTYSGTPEQRKSLLWKLSGKQDADEEETWIQEVLF